MTTDPGASKEAAPDCAAWPPPPGRSSHPSACEPYREWIEEAAERGRTAMAIWQDRVDDHGFRKLGGG